MSSGVSLNGRVCWPKISQVVPYLALCLVLVILSCGVVAAVVEQGKMAMKGFGDPKPRTPSRVEMQLLADLSARHRFPTPDPRPNQDRLSALAGPLVSAVTLAAQIDVLESGALSARLAEVTPKVRRSAKKRPKVARVAAWVKRSRPNTPRESTHEITLRNLIVADLALPTEQL